MAFTQINLDDYTSQRLKIYQAKNGISTKQQAIIQIVQEFLKE